MLVFLVIIILLGNYFNSVKIYFKKFIRQIKNSYRRVNEKLYSVKVSNNSRYRPTFRYFLSREKQQRRRGTRNRETEKHRNRDVRSWYLSQTSRDVICDERGVVRSRSRVGHLRRLSRSGTVISQVYQELARIQRAEARTPARTRQSRFDERITRVTRQPRSRGCLSQPTVNFRETSYQHLLYYTHGTPSSSY